MTSTMTQFLGSRVLVTGARGFLGSNLCQELLRSKAEVFAVTRRSPDCEDTDLHWLVGDVAKIGTVEDLFDVAKPDFVFHCTGSGQGGPEIDNVLPNLQDDLVPLVNVLVCVTKRTIRRLVLAASLEEPQPEKGESVPISPYAAAKSAGSSYARMFHALYGTPVVLTRPYMTYGPGQQHHKIIPHVVTSLLRGDAPRLGSGKRQVDWVYVDDVAKGMLAAACAVGVEGRTFDLGSGALVPIRDVVEEIVGIIGGSVQPLLGALPDRPVEQIRVADITKARELLGWSPETPLRAGLERTVEWYRLAVENSAVANRRN